MNIWIRNRITVAVCHFILILTLSSICRLIFFFFNSEFFDNASPLLFVYGLRFDVAVAAILYLPFWACLLFPIKLISKKRFLNLLHLLFGLGVAITLILECTDFQLFSFTLKRTTSDLFSMITTGGDWKFLIPTLLFDYWYVVIIFLIFLLSTLKLSRKLLNKLEVNESELIRTNGLLAKGATFIMVFAVLFVAGRGGMQLRPIGLITAGQYSNGINIPLVLNTPFAFIKTLGKERLIEKEFMNEMELDAYFNPELLYTNNEPEQKKNVVIIILESFSKEYIGALSGLEFSYTPFLDSLISKSTVCLNAFSNGRRSIEALPSIIASIPPLMETPYITGPYSASGMNSIATVLNEKGYNSMFFHGGNNGTMGFDNFIKAAGFNHYFGRDEYNNEDEYDGNWGIFDEPFLQYSVVKMTETREPFVSCIFTLSSHHPYTIPEKYKNTFPKGSMEIHESVGYADYSLRRFFEQAQTFDWYKNTLFILTADHTSMSEHPVYRSGKGAYSIPLIIFKPWENQQKVILDVSQHTDIFPTIMDELNISEKIISFGSSVYEKQNDIVVSYLNHMYQVISSDYYILFNDDDVMAIYKYKTDPLLSQNVLTSHRDSILEIEKKAKALIQNFNHRLINNQLRP